MFNQIYKTALTPVAAFIMMLSMSSTNAALVNYEIIGDVLSGDEFGANAFGLTFGETITVTGTFDDSVLAGGIGTVYFGLGSGNTMTLNVGTETFTASNDKNYLGGSNPYLTFDAASQLFDFDFLAQSGVNGAPANFNSSFMFFDDLGGAYGDLLGEWRANVTISPVPVPAAVWLFGSGLLGLAGIARRKSA